MTVIQSGKQLPYTLKSLTSCEPPFESDNNNWFKYMILQGSNIITGYKYGEFANVLESVELNVDRLNQRQIGKFGSMNTPKAKE